MRRPAASRSSGAWIQVRMTVLLQQEPGVLDQLWSHRRRGGREKRDVVALLAAEELIDGHAERLALDVIQGNVDRRDGGRHHPAALEVVRAVHLLPERADVHRVPADQELAEVADGALDRQLARGQAGLAPAVDALVGLDLDDELIAADQGGIGLDVPYLHGRSLSEPVVSVNGGGVAHRLITTPGLQAGRAGSMMSQTGSNFCGKCCRAGR